jgi:release factor glutamine methyltransferase
MEKVWTILDLITWGRAYFEEKGVDSPRLTMEILIAHVLQKARIQLYTQFDRPLGENELTTLRAMIKRRAAREPLQYILGETDFFGMTLSVNPAVLIPRPETELLVEYVLNRLKKDTSTTNENQVETTILDIGTGSGCIALALAKNISTSATLYGLDVSNDALALARSNAERNQITNVQFGKIDILEALPKRQFSVIVSNPPYISTTDMNELEPEVGSHEPNVALTDNADGMTFYRRFAEIFPQMLEERGWFAVEMGFGQGAMVEALFADAGFETMVINDFAGIPRICVGSRKLL